MVQVMNIDDVIQHCLEIVEDQKKLFALCPLDCDGHKDCKSLKRGRNCGCLKRAQEYEQMAYWLKDYKRLLAKEMGKDIKCGNCRHDDTDDDECKACYLYSRWEEEDV